MASIPISAIPLANLDTTAVPPAYVKVAKLINNQIVVTTGSASGHNPQATTWLGVGSLHKTVLTSSPL